MNRQLAHGVLISCGAKVGQDFHTLRASQVEVLLNWADHYHYRKPKNANGSRGRYFYQLVQCRAQAKE